MADDVTLKELDELIFEATELFSGEELLQLNKDIKSKKVVPNMCARFLRNLIARAEAKDVDKYFPAAEPKSVTLKPFVPDSNNPWSASGWSKTKQGDAVKSMGEAKALALAKSVGCTFASTKPNPAYNPQG